MLVEKWLIDLSSNVYTCLLFAAALDETEIMKKRHFQTLILCTLTAVQSGKNTNVSAADPLLVCLHMNYTHTHTNTH